MKSNLPAYGTPERAEYDRRSSNSYRAVEWCHQQTAALVNIESKDERLHRFHEFNNIFLNLRNMVLQIQEGAPVHFCTVCGAPELSNFNEPTKAKLVKGCLCFGCNFWSEHRTTYNAQNRKGSMLVINGDGRSDGGEQYEGPGCNKSFLGFGGHRWYVYQLTTGKLWTTNNMWSFGTIPKLFRPGMPDNAVLLTKEQYELAVKGREE